MGMGLLAYFITGYLITSDSKEKYVKKTALKSKKEKRLNKLWRKK